MNIQSPAAEAESFKTAGNNSFKAGDYDTAVAYYSRAIIKDSSKSVFFTNRANAFIHLEKWNEAVFDCQKALEIDPKSMKGYYFMALAQLKLGLPNETVTSAIKAYQFAAMENSPSLPRIAQLVLDAKRQRWEILEQRRIKEQNGLLEDIRLSFEAQADNEIRHGMEEWYNEPGMTDEEVHIREADIRKRWSEKAGGAQAVFGKADDSLKARVVPDYLVDRISFTVMIDPVMTLSGQSYDRVTLMEHLKRSPTDPLTREPLALKDLRSNIQLKEACEEFLKENGWAADY